MCLILIAREAHPDYKLIVAANRDEYYDRPTSALAKWADFPSVAAGRDLKSGGTWMGVTDGGRFAALTNYRDPRARREDAPSRGLLVSGFLVSEAGVESYLEDLKKSAADYNDFNFLAGGHEGLTFFSTRGEGKKLGTGVFGLSNHLLDTPWPKVEKGKEGLEAVLGYSGNELVDSLLKLLEDRGKAPDSKLPDTGIGIEWERVLSSIFIESPTYGTRSSSVVLFDRNGEITFIEQTFENGEKSGAPVVLTLG
jgi:uncharacterized protein with NRDE domain